MVDRKLIKRGFDKSTSPFLPCPSCGGGSLIFMETESDVKEQAWVRTAYNDPDFFTEWTRFNFSTLLTCSNSECGEAVAALGEAEYRESYDRDIDGASYPVLMRYYRPLFFHPPLKLFVPPHETPDELQEALDASFALFFADPASSANHVRNCTEQVLNILRIKRYTRTRNSRLVRLSLHRRIELIPDKHRDSKHLLLALKWLGNSGSHASSPITQDDVLDAYEILEHLIIELFSTQKKRVSKLAKKIVKSKGPVKVRRKSIRPPRDSDS